MVGEAQSRRAPSEQWVEKFARVYTPAVMALRSGDPARAATVLGATVGAWFYSALVLLVIACPCALVISTPVSIVAALAAAARQGVLVKGGVLRRSARPARAIAFDKTGTLTEGRPAVVEIVPLSGHDERELLERAAALEVAERASAGRGHRRLRRAARRSPPPAEIFRSSAAKGRRRRFNGRPLLARLAPLSGRAEPGDARGSRAAGSNVGRGPDASSSSATRSTCAA